MLINEVLARRRNFTALFLLALLTPYLLYAFGYLFDGIRPMDDVVLYGYWLQQMQSGELAFGLTQDFVYPYPSLLPMWLAQLIGGHTGILMGWLTLIALLNSFAIGFLTSWGQGSRRSMLAGLFWVSYLLLLGPSGVARIDAIAAVVAVFGLIAMAKDRIALAVGLFTFGAWIKIWPFALAVSAFIADKRKKIVSLASIAVVGAVVIVAIILGANSSLFSFVSTQGGRGIQIESPVAMFWIWAAKLGVADTGIYYDEKIITNQVYGSQVDFVSMLMTPIMFIAFAIIVWLGYRAVVAGAERKLVFATFSLTAVLVLIVFNKVGSPQFMAWLAIPMMALIIFNGTKLKAMAIGLLLIATTTNLVYPVLYIDLLGLGNLSVILLTLRNGLLIALLVYATWRLGQLAKTTKHSVALQSSALV